MAVFVMVVVSTAGLGLVVLHSYRTAFAPPLLLNFGNESFRNFQANQHKPLQQRSYRFKIPTYCQSRDGNKPVTLWRVGPTEFAMYGTTVSQLGRPAVVRRL